jgi:hypothetical protein
MMHKKHTGVRLRDLVPEDRPWSGVLKVETRTISGAILAA